MSGGQEGLSLLLLLLLLLLHAVLRLRWYRSCCFSRTAAGQSHHTEEGSATEGRRVTRNRWRQHAIDGAERPPM